MAYMTQLLEQLGWTTGERVPLASKENAKLEEQLLSRQGELKKLRVAVKRVDEKRADLAKYKNQVSSESQENTKLLVTHKQHHDQENALKVFQNNDLSQIKLETKKAQKELDEIRARINSVQGSTGRLLKRAEKLGKDVQLERHILEEWRLALDSSEDDIAAIQKYTKQDGTLAMQLETKRQLLKIEVDKAQNILSNLYNTVVAEETSRDRLSGKVQEALKQRQELVKSWSNAVENLRQRDEDINRTQEDCEILRNEIKVTGEVVSDKEEYLRRQSSDNNETRNTNIKLGAEVNNTRKRTVDLIECNRMGTDNLKGLQAILANLSKSIQDLYNKNKHCTQEIGQKETMLKKLKANIEDLESKCDKFKEDENTVQQRLKQITEMLKEEERYLQNLITNQERAMHCSYLEQQKLNAVVNKLKLGKVEILTFKSTITNLEKQNAELVKELSGVRQTLYQIEYTKMMIESDIDRFNKECEANDNDSASDEKIKILQRTITAYKDRAAALSTQMARLQRDMTALGNALIKEQSQLEKCEENLLNGQLWVEGEKTALKNLANETRTKKVDEALLRVRVTQSLKAVNDATNRTFELHTNKIDNETIMNERFVEIKTIKEMLLIQKRALLEDCGILESDLRQKTSRVEQLKKRHEIFMASFGKREDGQPLSVTFFKIKYAQERAELQEQGDILDAEMRKGEKEVRALETALKLISDSNIHFANKMSLVKDDEPEIIMVQTLNDKVDKLQMVVATLTSEINKTKIAVEEIDQLIANLDIKIKKLDGLKKEAKYTAQASEASLSKTTNRLRNAMKMANRSKKQAKEIFAADPNLVQLFMMEVKTKDHEEAIYNAMRQLNACMPDVIRDSCGKISL